MCAERDIPLIDHVLTIDTETERYLNESRINLKSDSHFPKHLLLFT